MLDIRYKIFAHIAQLVLILIVLGLAGYRMSNRAPNMRRNIGDTMAIGMSAKALIVVAYQLLTEHVASFHRWASLKANLILNCSEVVFWAVVGGLGMQGLAQFCGDGTVCAVGWLLHVLAFVLCIVAIYVSLLSYQEFKAYRRGGFKSSTAQIQMVNA